MRRHRETTIYDEIHLTGTLKLVWKSTPLFLRFITWPYGLWIYRDLLRQSRTTGQLLRVHDYQCQHSFVFRILGPKYYKAKQLLESYGIRN